MKVLWLPVSDVNGHRLRPLKRRHKPHGLVVADEKLQPDVQSKIFGMRDRQPELQRAIVGCGDVSDGDRGCANRWVISRSALRCAQFSRTDEDTAVAIDATCRINVAGRKLEGDDLIRRADAEFREPSGNRTHAVPFRASVIGLGVWPPCKDFRRLQHSVRLLLRELVSGPAAAGRKTRAAGRPENLPAMQRRWVDQGFGVVRHSWLLAWAGERSRHARAGPARSDIIL